MKRTTGIPMCENLINVIEYGDLLSPFAKMQPHSIAIPVGYQYLWFEINIFRSIINVPIPQSDSKKNKIQPKHFFESSSDFQPERHLESLGISRHSFNHKYIPNQSIQPCKFPQIEGFPYHIAGTFLWSINRTSENQETGTTRLAKILL